VEAAESDARAPSTLRSALELEDKDYPARARINQGDKEF
jgi:hypothetical protein